MPNRFVLQYHWILVFVVLVAGMTLASANGSVDPGHAIPINPSWSPDRPILSVDGSLLLWAADESLLGDLNGDGDTVDEVPHLYDAGPGTSQNLGLAGVDAHFWAVKEGVGMFYVSESANGLGDLNGDGDLTDKVLHIVNAAGTVRNTGLACRGTPALHGNWMAVLVDEQSQGNQDRNGDGDDLDPIAALYHVPTGAIRPLDVSGSSWDRLLGPRVLAWNVKESDESADLNGDGDQDDYVLATHHIPTNTTRVFPFAVSPQGSLGIDLRDHRLHQLKGNRVGVLVDEAAQSEDIDGDGDLADNVLVIADARTGVTIATRYPAKKVIQAQNGRLLVLVDEEEFSSGVDLDGNGATNDRDVAVSIRTSNGLGTPLGLVKVEALDRAGRWTLLTAREEESGRQDWNGDGDTGDEVVHLYDHATNTLRVIPLAATRFWIGGAAMDGNQVAITVDELDHGHTDLNGDGDLFDEILHIYNIASGLIKNTMRDSEWVIDVRNGHASYVISEPAIGSGGFDANQDGVIGDRVVRLVDLTDASVTETFAGILQGSGPWDSVRHTSFGVWAAARELSHGCDLNGDGDPLDYVAALARH